MADPTVTPLFNVPMSPAAVRPAGAVQASAGPVAQGPPARYVEQDGKHKGVAGVGRDILGTLGDFLLTKLGLPAMYGPAQKQRKLEIAMADFDTNPVDAINRVTDVDYAAGTKLRDQFIDNQRLAAQQASTAEARAERLALAQAAQNDRTRGRAAAMLGTMTQWDDPKRAQNYGALRTQVLRYGQANGLDLSSELPEAYDGVSLDAFIDQAVPVGTQRAQRLTEERIDNQDRQADARIATTERGQDISSADRRRGQDIGSGDRRRGQDISAGTAANRDATTRRGQDIGSGDRRRGQDLRGQVATQRDATTRRGQDMRDSTTRRGQDMRPRKFVPDPNKIYIQGGRRFRYNAGTKKYEAL